MNYTELSNYLQTYLQTNDQSVIDNIPNFLTLAAARIANDLRTALIEQSSTLLNVQVQPLPTGAMAINQLRINNFPVGYVTPNEFGLGAIGYTVQSNSIYINPAPVTGDVAVLTYYAANSGDKLASALPHLFLHGGAAEAEYFQGDNEDANNEIVLYKADVNKANGWDIYSGPISMGQKRITTSGFEDITVTGAPIAAIDVSYTQTGVVFGTNVQEAITEVGSNLSTHIGNNLNPHGVTIDQVAPTGDTGDVLQIDSNGNWVAAPPGGTVAVTSFNTRTGAVLPLEADYASFYAPINSGVTLFNGRSGNVNPIASDYNSFFASTAQGNKADTAVQPGQNVSLLVNDAGYLTAATAPGVNTFNGRSGTVVPAGNDYSLNLLSDVTITTPTNNQVLSYNGSQWVNTTSTTAPVTSVFTRTGAITAQAGDYSSFYATTAQGSKADTALQPTSSINALADVTITTAAVNNQLTYNGSQWVNTIPVGIDKIQAVTTPSNVNIDLGAYLTYTATGANTWTFTTSIATGFEVSWTLELNNGGLGAQTFTGVKWAGGTAPTLTAAGTDILVFTKNITTSIVRGYVAALDSK